ncbi:16S rRNA (guanine(527)-N(7))-methyltransferase RsmG [Bartonella sp. W8122]|uniref:16S rRNA (guanine(527)-N(7))-methyltransferase RsmG n=1 Tax=Bartonella sp. W8122 TaxID=2750930 RepID=UPI0018DE8C0B|nr:16S rRNA (guanine(527)-N(7))-methyltransferase RsmG [Bartonella sp. W8122]MBI0000463.1 16S rRNA (guanine(527)-N(7))-methyltransferase RsmG [Bartonella sp. W8122]
MTEWVEEKYLTLKEIVHSVSRETAASLMAFEEAVKKWQSHINLIANATLPELWTRHILDSAQIAALQPDAKNWCDIGSGGGFPGIVTAILLKEKSGFHIDLVESNSKKAAFLRSVSAEFNLPATVHTCRIETSYIHIKKPEIITSRALASLGKLVELTLPWFEQGATALFQKGRDYKKEMAEAEQNWTFNSIIHQSKIDSQSVILEISKINPRKG